MKIGVIAELLRKPLRESIATVARMGAKGVQIYALNPAHDLTKYSDAQLEELRQFVESHGLVVSALGGDIPGHGFRRVAENPAKIELEKRMIDIAIKLGTNVVTTHIGVVPSTDHPDYPGMVAALAELGEYAVSKGAVLAIETGPETAEVLAQFIKDTGSEGVGVNFDPANLVMVLNADPVASVRILGKRIVHTHVKDGIHYRKCDPEKVYGAFAEGGFEQLLAETGELFAEVTPGKGQVIWPEYLRALREVGFDGFLTIEREVGDNPEEDITKAISFIESQLKALA
jgi:L-ribulose-5-phosphate 3-epimerase